MSDDPVESHDAVLSAGEELPPRPYDTDAPPTASDVMDELEALEGTTDDAEALASILGISAVTALVAMTVWRRLDWTGPWLAVCQPTVAFVSMTIGAALGDLLPES